MDIPSTGGMSILAAEDLVVDYAFGGVSGVDY